MADKIIASISPSVEWKTHKTAKKVEYSWTHKYKKNGKEHSETKKGKWQLRVKYRITNDYIYIRPYIVISGDGFKEQKKCTIECSYQHNKKSSKAGWTNIWETKKISKTDSIKTKGKHIDGFWSKAVSIKTFKVHIVAKISGKTSEATITTDLKPPKPIPMTFKGTNHRGLSHSEDQPRLWKMKFKFDPVGTTDFAKPVDSFHIERTDSSTQTGWTEVYKKNTKHDVNGFIDDYQDNVNVNTSTRYKWRISFVNDAGRSPYLLLPVGIETSKHGKVMTQEDKLSEWAYMPPPKVDISSIHRYDYAVGKKNADTIDINWTRNGTDVDNGIIRGYFFQYQQNKEIGTNTWHWLHRRDHKELYRIYKEHLSDSGEFTNSPSINVKCDKNTKIRFRLVAFNFDFGVVPDHHVTLSASVSSDSGTVKAGTKLTVSTTTVKASSLSKFERLTPGLARVQKATASDPTDTIYFKPAKPDEVTAVCTENPSQEDGYFEVTINYTKAAFKSVDCARIYRRYHLEDGTTSSWIRCVDPTTGTQMDENGVSVDNWDPEYEDHGNKHLFKFKDIQDKPDTYGQDNKRVLGISYAAELGTNHEAELSEFYPKGESRFSNKTVMTGDYISSLKKPNAPTLLMPENGKTYPEDTESVELSWVHNPTDGTDQTTAKLNIFVFDGSIEEIPDDFFTAYTLNGNERNEVDIEGDIVLHYFDLGQTIYKITSIDTYSKTFVTSQSTISANDTILWRVKTKGMFNDYSDFSTEKRIFKICGIPELTFIIDNLADEKLHNLPAKITWTYSDQSGELAALRVFLSKNGSVLETYNVDLEEGTNTYSFSYLFDNGEEYTISAEALSTTTLTAFYSVPFTVEYVTVTLKKQLAVGAYFEEENGFAYLDLQEETSDGTQNDDAEIPVEPGSEETKTGTIFQLNIVSEKAEESNLFNIKALLDKSISDICLGVSEGIIDETMVFPQENRYPGDDIYPVLVFTTNDQDTDYILYDDLLDPESVDPTLNIYCSMKEDKGIFNIPIDVTTDPITYWNTNVLSIKLNYITNELSVLHESEYISITNPIIGGLFDDLDSLDLTPEEIMVDEEAVVAYLYRYYRGEKTFIGQYNPNFEDNKDISKSIIDRFCPINNEFSYQLVQITESGYVSFSEFIFKFDSLYWYSYWGPEYDNVAKARWNSNGSANFTRPERQSVRYSGRRYPVIYDSDAMEETYSLSVELFEDDYMTDVLLDYDTALETIDAYRELMLSGGVGFWKSFEGDVYFATFDFSYSVDYMDGIKKYPCSLNVTRIEGDEIFTEIEVV